jgi:hypothetical protein
LAWDAARDAIRCDANAIAIMGLANTIPFLLNHPLSRGRKVATLTRFALWQCRARTVGGAMPFEFVNGSKLLAAPGLTGATGNLYVGLHEFEEMAFALHFLRPGDLFADVGANVGSYTILVFCGGHLNLSANMIQRADGTHDT